MLKIQISPKWSSEQTIYIFLLFCCFPLLSNNIAWEPHVCEKMLKKCVIISNKKGEWSSQCKINQLNYISSQLKPIWSRKSGWVLTLIWLKCVTHNCVAPYHQLSIEHCNNVKLAENILCALDSRIRGNNDVDQLNWFSEPNAPGQENWDNEDHVES